MVHPKVEYKSWIWEFTEEGEERSAITVGREPTRASKYRITDDARIRSTVGCRQLIGEVSVDR